MNKKSIIVTIFCYTLWGLLPAYWALLSHVDPMTVLSMRITFSLIFIAALLPVMKKTGLFFETLRDGKKMRYLAPAAIFITINWGLYIWSVSSGHVLDSSLGYYMNPLVVFAIGALLFREKCSKLQIAAVLLALVGVIVSVAAYGSFPYISVILACSFGVYGLLKKKAHADPVASIGVETLLLTPFALAFVFIFRGDSISSLVWTDLLLFAGAGVVTALPLILYAKAVNDVPFFIVGFLQYISPTLMLVYGLLTGETLNGAQAVSFAFIGAGLVLFGIATVLNERKAAKSRSLEQAA